MRKIPRFLFLFILLLILSIGGAVLYHWKVTQVEASWLFFESLSTILTYLPLVASISILWSLVFKGKNEMSGNDSGFVLQFLFFILFNLTFAIIINEVALPSMEQNIIQTRIYKKMGLKSKPKLKEIQEGKIRMSELNNLQYFPYKENVAFKMGKAVVSMERVYKADAIYYIKNMKIFGYDKNDNLYYIITTPFAKEVGGEILTLNAKYWNVKSGNISLQKTVNGQKVIPLVYNINAIYQLSPGNKARTTSLVNIVRYQDFIFNSGINFHYLSALVYNKISYYMILIILMIIAASMGKTLKNERTTTGKDIVRIIFSYSVSLVLMVLAYDMLIRFSNMIQGLIT